MSQVNRAAHRETCFRVPPVFRRPKKRRWLLLKITAPNAVAQSSVELSVVMDENLAWDDLNDGVKFRFRDSILLVKNHRGGWIECRSVYPENDFVITVKRNAYEEWQTDLFDAKRRLLSSY